MSDALSISAVTLTLRRLLFVSVERVLPGTDVTTRPPDRARDGNRGNQLNVFLYQTAVNGSLRNLDPPGLRPGEESFPALPLSLCYLVTAYGEDDDDAVGHRLLGAAMSALHDRPLLGPEDIRGALPESNLHQQVERVRITNEPLSVDELSKLWTTFQAEYRISTAYRTSVVLIDSERPRRAAAPVLARGAEDAGPIAVPSTRVPWPTLERLDTPTRRGFALPGDTVVLTGHHLFGEQVHVAFEHPAIGADAILANPVSADATQVRAIVPDAAPAGRGAVRVTVTTAEGDAQRSNPLSLAVAPKITTQGPFEVERDDDGGVELEVDVAPPLRAPVGGRPQYVLLLAGNAVVEPAAFDDRATTLRFAFRADKGSHLVRLRVDDVDSPHIDETATPPRFDPSQRLDVVA